MAIQGDLMVVTDFDSAAKFAQDCIARVPAIVLGSGASIPFGYASMPALAVYLTANVAVGGLSAQEQAQWGDFQNLLAQSDLERALTEIQTSDPLTQRIIEATWDCIAASDRSLFLRLIADPQCLPLTRLFRKLLGTTHDKIDVVTTNYDLVAEYAADGAAFCHHTGFSHGHYRTRYSGAAVEFVQAQKPARKVNIWKVHGSLDWFETADKVTVGLPVPERRYDGLTPVIVTPGVDKYRRSLQEPFRTILTAADVALVGAPSYLCIGYGFNDEHIQPKLIERCRNNPVPLVIITKGLTAKTQEFLASGQCRSYLALEKCADGTKVYSNDIPGGFDLAGKQIWSFPDFLDMVGC